jgi:hypothetical protein
MGGHREFDLDLKFNQMWFKKIKKNGKPVHGVMICDMVPSKNTKHGSPRFHRKTLHKKWHHAGLPLLGKPLSMGPLSVEH